jgi:hypothetical protein
LKNIFKMSCIPAKGDPDIAGMSECPYPHAYWHQLKSAEHPTVNNI